MKLLILNSEAVKKWLDNLEEEVKDIKAGCLKMSWFMRGGVSYVDILNMSTDERKTINKIIEENLETTKTSRMPFF
jgi:hypothetical protein